MLVDSGRTGVELLAASIWGYLYEAESLFGCGGWFAGNDGALHAGFRERSGFTFTNGLAAPNSANLLINLNNIYNVTNTGGTITFNPTTETLSMTSTITSISSGNMVYTGDFGTVTFTTGALTSGSIYGYATFNGGTYTYTTNGTDGLPNGVLFSGTFGLIHWHKIGEHGRVLVQRLRYTRDQRAGERDDAVQRGSGSGGDT